MFQVFLRLYEVVGASRSLKDYLRVSRMPEEILILFSRLQDAL
jgi:hypothetical protein